MSQLIRDPEDRFSNDGAQPKAGLNLVKLIHLLMKEINVYGKEHI